MSKTPTTRDLGEKPAFPPLRGPSESGLTKREWMATQILGGLVTDREALTEDLAGYAVCVADRLLQALRYPEDPPRI